MTQINLFEVMKDTYQFRRIFGILILLEDHKLVIKARGQKITFTSQYNIKEMLHGSIIAGFVRPYSDNVIYPLPLLNKTHNHFEPWMERNIDDPDYDIWEHASLKAIMEELNGIKGEAIRTLENFKKLYDSDNLINIEDVIKNIFSDVLNLGPAQSNAVQSESNAIATNANAEAIHVNVNTVQGAEIPRSCRRK